MWNRMTNTSVNLSGIDLSSPVILASGILDETPKTLAKVAGFGPGAMVTKSIGSEPREGNVSPVLIETTDGMLNSMGLPNPGIEEFLKEFDEAEDIATPVILSIFGANPEEFATLAQKAQGHGFAGLELNLSCPNAVGVGQEVGQDPDRVKDVTKAVKNVSQVPVFVKLTPNISNIVPLARAAKEGGAEGVVAINTIKGIAIDHKAKCPVLGNVFGGLSGPAIKPVGLRMVWEIFSAGLDFPIIGCGGIIDHKDVLEYILAGAAAVEVGTAVYYKGPEVLKEITQGLADYMGQEGVEDLGELRGLAHRRV